MFIMVLIWILSAGTLFFYRTVRRDDPVRRLFFVLPQMQHSPEEER